MIKHSSGTSYYLYFINLFYKKVISSIDHWMVIKDCQPETLRSCRADQTSSWAKAN